MYRCVIVASESGRGCDWTDLQGVRGEGARGLHQCRQLHHQVPQRPLRRHEGCHPRSSHSNC